MVYRFLRSGSNYIFFPRAQSVFPAFILSLLELIYPVTTEQVLYPAEILCPFQNTLQDFLEVLLIFVPCLVTVDDLSEIMPRNPFSHFQGVFDTEGRISVLPLEEQIIIQYFLLKGHSVQPPWNSIHSISCCIIAYVRNQLIL